MKEYCKTSVSVVITTQNFTVTIYGGMWGRGGGGGGGLIGLQDYGICYIFHTGIWTR